MQQPVRPPGLKEVNEGKGETGISSNRIHLKIQVMKLNQIEADVWDLLLKVPQANTRKRRSSGELRPPASSNNHLISLLDSLIRKLSSYLLG